jgi:hypothetical protein
MKVRFRFHQGRRVTRRRGKNRRLAAAVGALLIPIALMAWVLSLWRIGSDLGVAGEFAITGLFSHWQVWIAVALGLSFAASMLNRYGRGGELEESRVVTPFPHQNFDRDSDVAARRKAGSGS